MPWSFIIQLVMFFLERYLKEAGKDIDWDKVKAAMDEHIRQSVHRDRLEKVALAVADMALDIVKFYMKSGMSLKDALERLRHTHPADNGGTTLALTTELQRAKGWTVA